MNKLKKVVLEVKVKDTFICIKNSNYFTKGRTYVVQGTSYNTGTGDTVVEFLDNDCDIHPVEGMFLSIHFKKQ